MMTRWLNYYALIAYFTGVILGGALGSFITIAIYTGGEAP